MEHLMNKTLDEIKAAYNEWSHDEDDIREMIRLYLSKRLMDTSEDNKLECDIVLETEDCCGLSSLDMPWIIAMWQHPTEGWITFLTDTRCERDFDDMDTEELIIIAEGLSYE